jgi:pimeloyl-ACP methyl ester carboxylesterase
MATFVLVHGAFVGGWYWRWIAPYLREAGHEVFTPTLTGLGERSHLATPEVSLETHIEDVLAVYHFEDLSETILVGHSYGGMIVAAVADRVPERVRHLVYFDSDVPADGDTSSPPSRHAALVERAREDGDGWRVPLAPGYVPSQLAGLPPAEVDWFLDRLALHPLRTWLEPIRLSGGGATVPATYLRCTVGYDPDDEDTQRQDRRIHSEPTWHYREIDAPHLALVTHPALVAKILLETAQQAKPD